MQYPGGEHLVLNWDSLEVMLVCGRQSLWHFVDDTLEILLRCQKTLFQEMKHEIHPEKSAICFGIQSILEVSPHVRLALRSLDDSFNFRLYYEP
jgi:hypothetical protein